MDNYVTLRSFDEKGNLSDDITNMAVRVTNTNPVSTQRRKSERFKFVHQMSDQ